ncbi:hypothetical protein ACFCVO_08900 [Agromyces sp. NPDC056379]|uniref:hypothetical protein n=1 Tax=unclassified Agromyces TaxID=2639701 RepID=UPI0035D77C93
MTGVLSRLAAIVRRVANRRTIVVGAIALVGLGIAASVAVSLGVQEEHRRQVLADVTSSAATLETKAASVSAAGAQYEADVSAAAELAAELSATLELPPQRFDPAARTEVERALAQLANASSSLPAPSESIVLVRDEATLEELRSAEKDLTDAIGDLDDRADELESRRSELADATDEARSAAKTLVDGVIGGTESLLAAHAAASVESSDRVRTIVAALGVAWAADDLREWVDAVAALEASSAEAAARLALEDQGVDEDEAGAGAPTTSTSGPGWPPTWKTPTFPPLSTEPPSPTPVDIWPLIWNEHWRPYEECVGMMGHVKTFPTNDFGYGLDSGMTTPWTHAWGGSGISIYTCGY